MGLAVVSAFLGAVSLDAAWWWGALLVASVVSLPGILIRLSVRILRRPSKRRGPVHHVH